MAIRVNTHSPLGSDRFNAATGWHVDDNGYLHVIEAGKGNLATFHPGAWQSVERVEETGGKAQSINISTPASSSAIAGELAHHLQTK